MHDMLDKCRLEVSTELLFLHKNQIFKGVASGELPHYQELGALIKTDSSEGIDVCVSDVFELE